MQMDCYNVASGVSIPRILVRTPKTPYYKVMVQPVRNYTNEHYAVDILTVAKSRTEQNNIPDWSVGEIDVKTANTLIDVDSIPIVVVVNQQAVNDLSKKITSTLGRSYPPSLIAEIPIDWSAVKHQAYDYTDAIYKQCLRLLGKKQTMFAPFSFNELTFIEDTFLLKHLGRF